jgi:hypothetical protein
MLKRGKKWAEESRISQSHGRGKFVGDRGYQWEPWTPKWAAASGLDEERVTKRQFTLHRRKSHGGRKARLRRILQKSSPAFLQRETGLELSLCQNDPVHAYDPLWEWDDPGTCCVLVRLTYPDDKDLVSIYHLLSADNIVDNLSRLLHWYSAQPILYVCKRGGPRPTVCTATIADLLCFLFD